MNSEKCDLLSSKRRVRIRIKRIILATFSILLFSCAQENALDGTYISSEKSFVYGLKVNQSEKEVRLYLLEELSTEITFEEYSAQQNWDEYRVGTLKPKHANSWYLVGVDSDVDRSDKPETINLITKNDTLKLTVKTFITPLQGPHSSYLVSFVSQILLCFTK